MRMDLNTETGVHCLVCEDSGSILRSLDLPPSSLIVKRSWIEIPCRFDGLGTKLRDSKYRLLYAFLFLLCHCSSVYQCERIKVDR